MSKNIIPNPTCNKCGKEAPRDKEKSNKNWAVFRTKEPCSCGGRFGIDLSKLK